MTKEQGVKKHRVQNYLKGTQQWQVNLPERSMRQVIRTALMEALESAGHQKEEDDWESLEMTGMTLRIQDERGRYAGDVHQKARGGREIIFWF